MVWVLSEEASSEALPPRRDDGADGWGAGGYDARVELEETPERYT